MGRVEYIFPDPSIVRGAWISSVPLRAFSCAAGPTRYGRDTRAAWGRPVDLRPPTGVASSRVPAIELIASRLLTHGCSVHCCRGVLIAHPWEDRCWEDEACGCGRVVARTSPSPKHPPKVPLRACVCHVGRHQTPTWQKPSLANASCVSVKCRTYKWRY